MSTTAAATDRPRSKSFFRGLVAFLFVLAGAMHFIRPKFYLTIMPPMLPAPMALIYLSGAFEILGGLGLLVPLTRRFSGYGLMALLLAVLPANAQMLVDDLHHHPFSLITVVLILRLPLQFVFMAIVNRVSQSPST